jgi:hypothetical protein
MSNVKSPRLPGEYIYVDVPGIESLYAQIVDAAGTSRTTTAQKGLSAKVGSGSRLRNFLVTLLRGLGGEASAALTASHAWTEESTRVQTAERRVERVVDLLSKYGHDYFFTSLSEASRRLQTTDVPVFINILDSFNAPQLYWRWLGTDRVNSDGYLLLEKGGAVDYNYADDYYKQFSALVRLSASTKKMMTRALWRSYYFRDFAGGHVPFGVFGILSGPSDYLQIKPFAITAITL